MIARCEGAHPYGLRGLTTRELQLVVLGCFGLTNKEIAARLGISCGTVITLWSRIRVRLGLRSKVMATTLMYGAICDAVNWCARQSEEPSETSIPGALGEYQALVTLSGIVLASGGAVSKRFAIRPGLPLADRNSANGDALESGCVTLATVSSCLRNLHDYDELVLPKITVFDRDSHDATFSVRVHTNEASPLGPIAFLEFVAVGQAVASVPVAERASGQILKLAAVGTA